MSKYREVSDETQKLFHDVLDKTALPQWVEFKLLANDKLKDIYQVKKSSDLVEALSGGINITVLLNEQVFDNLPEEYKELVLEEALGGVVVNEKDAIAINKFDFTTYSGFLSKYGAEKMIQLKESITSIYQKLKEEEEQNK